MIIPKRRIFKILIIGAIVAFVFSVMGCRDTDVLKEIIYDQSAEIVDYNNQIKYYINDSTAKETSELVSAVEVNKDAKQTDEVQNLVVYSSKPNSPNYTAKKSLFSIMPDFSGIEASEGVSFIKSEAKDALERESPSPDNNESKSDSTVAPSNGGSGDSANNGKNPSGKDKTKEPDKSNDGGGSSGDVKVNDTTGKYSDPPKVNRVAAFGQAAVIAQMVGGKGGLVAADKDLLTSDFKTVFASEGASSIKQGWKDGGSVEKIDVDAIIAAKADTILAFSSNYLSELSKEQRKKLNKAKITCTIIPALTNSNYIMNAVDIVAKMFSESTSIGNAGSTQSIADSYSNFHDKVMRDCIDANGGTLAGSKIYEEKNSIKYSYKENAPYTLLIDGFDTSARYTGKYSGSFTPNSSSGVALATIGWGQTPVSYYIQAGGLINNAAAKSTKSDIGKTIVWQFNTNMLSFEKSKWSYKKDGELSKISENNLNSNKASGWGLTLTTTAENKDGNGVGSSFGTSTFPKLIAGSADIKNNIIDNSADSSGIYHPYNRVDVSSGSTSVSAFGKLVGTSVLYSSIGVDGSLNPTNAFSANKITSTSIDVNPHGMFTSWTEGSVESVLEAAWVNDEVINNSNKVNISSLIKDFYKDFYRYNLNSTQVSSILKGK